MLAIITAVKSASNSAKNIYYAIADRPYSFACDVMLGLGEKHEIDVSALRKGHVGIDEIKQAGTASNEEYEAAMEHIMKDYGFWEAIEAPKTIKELKAPTKKMRPALDMAAKRLARSIFAGGTITVRFHNDCDGSSGAIALYEAIEELKKRIGARDLPISWKMNRSVGYSLESFYEDYESSKAHRSMENPLVVITDFGTMQESEGAIDASAKEHHKCDFIWLDHHPIYEGFDNYKRMLAHYINTWDFGGNSDYTAGYLTCVFAEMIAPIDTEDLRQASLIGDFSAFGKRDEKRWQKLAVVLDYLTSRRESEGAISPKSMASIIKDRERFEETFVRASAIIQEAIDIGVNKVRHYKGRDGMNVYVLDFKHIIREDGETPLPGRFSSRLQEKMEEISGKRTITMVHYGNYVSLRANKDLAEEIQLLKILEGAKNSSEHIQSFGGHNPAASVRTDKEHITQVVKLILAALGAE